MKDEIDKGRLYRCQINTKTVVIDINFLVKSYSSNNLNWTLNKLVIIDWKTRKTIT